MGELLPVVRMFAAIADTKVVSSPGLVPSGLVDRLLLGGYNISSNSG